MDWEEGRGRRFGGCVCVGGGGGEGKWRRLITMKISWWHVRVSSTKMAASLLKKRQTNRDRQRRKQRQKQRQTDR